MGCHTCYPVETIRAARWRMRLPINSSLPSQTMLQSNMESRRRSGSHESPLLKATQTRRTRMLPLSLTSFCCITIFLNGNNPPSSPFFLWEGSETFCSLPPPPYHIFNWNTSNAFLELFLRPVVRYCVTQTAFKKHSMQYFIPTNNNETPSITV